MAKDIYEPPSSDLSVQFDRDDRITGKRARKFTLLAFLVAPIVAISLLVGMAMFKDGISETDFEQTGRVFIDGLLFGYPLTLILGLPLHWLLGQLDLRKLYIYLVAGSVIPSPLVLISGSYDSAKAWAVAAVVGATWSLAFWFIAVYLLQRRGS